MVSAGISNIHEIRDRGTTLLGSWKSFEFINIIHRLSLQEQQRHTEIGKYNKEHDSKAKILFYHPVNNSIECSYNFLQSPQNCMQQFAEKNNDNFEKQNVGIRFGSHMSTELKNLFRNDAIIDNNFTKILLNEFSNENLNEVMPVQIGLSNNIFNINVTIINIYQSNACMNGRGMECGEVNNRENETNVRYGCNHTANDAKNVIDKVGVSKTNDTAYHQNYTNYDHGRNEKNTFTDVKIDFENINVTRFVEITLIQIAQKNLYNRSMPRKEKSDFESAIIRQFKSKKLYLINITVFYLDNTFSFITGMNCSCNAEIKNCEITGFLEVSKCNLDPQVSFVCYDNHDDEELLRQKIYSNDDCDKKNKKRYENYKNGIKDEKPTIHTNNGTDKNTYSQQKIYNYKQLDAIAKDCIEMELNKIAHENPNLRVPRVIEGRII